MFAVKHLFKRTTVVRHHDALGVLYTTDAPESSVAPFPSRPPRLFLNHDAERERKQKVELRDVFYQHHSFWMNLAANEDWSNTWPALAPFDPYVVPLPVRMGFTAKLGIKPDKFSSLELLKVQNFLHLTPPAIEKHCKALKEFCTKFPKELDSDAACEREFPISVRTTDYLGAANSPRVPKARFVTLQFRLSSLGLDARSRIKLIRLLGKRYDHTTDRASIRTGRCPVRKQNKDFLKYVLTALYFESWKQEEWESVDCATDFDFYVWENSSSYKNLRQLLQRRGDIGEDTVLSDIPQVRDYQTAVEDIKQDLTDARRLKNETMKKKPLFRQTKGYQMFAKSTPKRQACIDNYKESVLKLLNLKRSPVALSTD